MQLPHTHTHTHTHRGKGMESSVVYAVDPQTDRHSHDMQSNVVITYLQLGVSKQ